MIILELLILIYSVILHEIAHGWIADKLGDPTARLSGRLTLDPRPHIDPIMTVLLPLVLVLTGSSLIFGAAKPVPIDPYNFKDPKKDIALASAAGPIMNLLIALFFALLARILPLDIFLYGAYINIFLAIFNLLPIPPLDGFKVIAGLLPDNLARSWLSFERLGLTFLLLLLFLLPGLISGLVTPLVMTILKFLF